MLFRSYISVLNPLSDADLISYCSEAAFIGLTRRTTKNFHAGLIHALPHLKGISVYATGTEWIDVAALEQRHVCLKHLPDYSQDSVAEHTLGMLLTLSRRIHLSDRIAREDLPRTVSLRGWEIKAKTIGIIGMGRIGQRIAELLQAFGVHLLYYDIQEKSIPDSLVHACDSQAQLLSVSDVVILCASMNRDSPTIVGEDEFAQIKPNAIVLNPGRAELVDRAAVYSALQAKRIAGYALDDYVFSAAEVAQLEHGRLLQTGHTAWYSDEAMQRGTDLWIQQLAEMIQND